MGMKVLLVGSGAREHAIAWRLARSEKVQEIFVAPGNAGTASIGTNLPCSAEDIEGLADLADTHGIDLTFVGPEVPLANGIVDLFQRRRLAAFGPTKAAARIESSKTFAKKLMRRHGIPCPEFNVFESYQEAHEFVSVRDDRVVIKADGLAAGKGVLLCDGRADALDALESCMKEKAFGAAGETVVVEEYLEGREVSVFAFADGEHLSPLVAACDYKRLLDGDMGPNTGGMGSYTPPELWTSELRECVRDEIMVPTLSAMKGEGAPYQGVLYAGLMVTKQGPKVLEFNCRLGDPETQVILPLLKTDLLDVAMACLGGTIDQLPIVWEDTACVGVVMASGGYPSSYAKGQPISGLGEVESDVLVFHAGTRIASDGNADSIVTDGGRVLTVVGRGLTLAEARATAYNNVSRISFQDAHYRRDIGLVRETATL